MRLDPQQLLHLSCMLKSIYIINMLNIQLPAAMWGSLIVWLFLTAAEDADGLCSALTEPCPKQAGMIPFKRLEVDRLKIEIQTKLGQGQFGEVWEGLK